MNERTIAAHAHLCSGLAVRACLAAVGAIVLIAGGVVVARAGITDGHLPAYVPGMTTTVIPTYSGPLIGAALLLGLLGGLLLVSAVTDGWRWRIITAAKPQPAH